MKWINIRLPDLDTRTDCSSLVSWTLSAIQCHNFSKQCHQCPAGQPLDREWKGGILDDMKECKMPLVVQKLLNRNELPPKTEVFSKYEC